MDRAAIADYRELRELGRGGGGRVVLAEHVPTGTRVAVKHLAERLVTEPEFVEAFRDEARLLAELDHPNIVRLYEYIEGPHDTAIVMEYVEGASLRTMLGDLAPLPPEAALAVLEGSLAGLAAAHARGVVHRDFKPDNVLVAVSGDSKLADFGIAARSGQAGPAAGTPRYTAPEQWAGAVADAAGDLYAATAVFFECITGAPPFTGKDAESLRWQHEQAPVPLDSVPERLRPLVARGLAKTPAERPADAAQFLAELREAASAAYGRDWDEHGRGLLAEAVMLLLLHQPPAQPPAASTALAQTKLRPAAGTARLLARLLHPRHPRRTMATAAVGAAVVAAIVSYMSYTAPKGAAAEASSALGHGRSATTVSQAGPGVPVPGDPRDQSSSIPTPPDTAVSPSPAAPGNPGTVTVSSPSGGSNPSTPISVTSSVPSASSAPPASPPPPNPAAPPPPAQQVLTVAASLADDPSTGWLQATVTVTTADISPVTLSLCYAANVGPTAGPPWAAGPSCQPTRTLQGNTTYTVTDVYDPGICYEYAQVVATTVPAASGGPVTASFSPSVTCIQ